MPNETPDQAPSGGKVIDMFSHRKAKSAGTAPTAQVLMETAFQKGLAVRTPEQERFHTVAVAVVTLLNIARLPAKHLKLRAIQSSGPKTMKENEVVKALILFGGKEQELFRVWFENGSWNVVGGRWLAKDPVLADALAAIVERDHIAQTLAAKVNELAARAAFVKRLQVGAFVGALPILAGLVLWLLS